MSSVRRRTSTHPFFGSWTAFSASSCCAKRRTARTSPARKSRFPDHRPAFSRSRQNLGATLFEDFGRGEEVAGEIEPHRRPVGQQLRSEERRVGKEDRTWRERKE